MILGQLSDVLLRQTVAWATCSLCRRITYLLHVVLSIAATAAGKRVSKCFMMLRGTPVSLNIKLIGYSTAAFD